MCGASMLLHAYDNGLPDREHSSCSGTGKCSSKTELGFRYNCVQWVRPPSIQIGSVETMAENGSAVCFLNSVSKAPPTSLLATLQIQQMSDGVKINLGVDISYVLVLIALSILTIPFSVSNPNYFSVDFKKIQAEVNSNCFLQDANITPFR